MLANPPQPESGDTVVLERTDTGESELTVSELMLVVDAIAKLGVQTLVLSGGEPLSRGEELFRVLQEAKKCGLKTGLLTNGIKPDHTPLSPDECRRLFDYCEWLQISIDSFDHTPYRQPDGSEKTRYMLIRGIDGLDIALTSLKNLRQGLSAAKPGSTGTLRDHLEICYTIQKDNIEEVAHTRALLEKNGLDWCWDLLRFKYAHGPEPINPDGKVSSSSGFLCKAEDIQRLIRTMSSDDHFSYLTDGSRFLPPDVALGQPTLGMAGRFREMGIPRKCQALNFTCTIDAFGHIYPCCFLFDDNSDRPDVRAKYHMGSLRPSNRESVGDDCFDLLRKAWQGGQLNELRSRDLMIDEKACCYCTRHIYNNEFLNKLQRALDTYGEHFDLENIEDILSSTPGAGLRAPHPYWL
jgi:MoaA/NifB/PqqE/SkfB family radical SAM enzyme